MAERRAHAEFKRQKHPREEAAVRIKHEADAQSHDAHAEDFRPPGRVFDNSAALVAEALIASAVAFRQRLLAAHPVPADGGGGDENFRRLRKARHEADEVLNLPLVYI